MLLVVEDASVTVVIDIYQTSQSNPTVTPIATALEQQANDHIWITQAMNFSLEASCDLLDPCQVLEFIQIAWESKILKAVWLVTLCYNSM